MLCTIDIIMTGSFLLKWLCLDDLEIIPIPFYLVILDLCILTSTRLPTKLL